MVRTVNFLQRRRKMEKYKEIYRVLLKLCENEELRLIEAELEDESIICKREKDMIILNTKNKNE